MRPLNGPVVVPDGGARSVTVEVRRVGASGPAGGLDGVAVEEPLEIRVGPAGEPGHAARSLSITMRTPGHDDELAAGFLLTEGLIRGRDDLASVRSCGRPSGPHGLRNVVRVGLAPGLTIDPSKLERHFYATSSCGVCGKASLDALRPSLPSPLEPDRPRVVAEVVHRLPARLREAQDVFDRTGGLHAAALFDPVGNLLAVREDVGRHNAVDKIVGRALLDGALPLRNRILLVSGRAGFELVQKALMAGAAVLAAVGAPSSLAVELAREHGMTLLGFVRDDRFNIYSGGGRVD